MKSNYGWSDSLKWIRRCCTLKFALPFSSTFSHHKTLGAQDQVRVCSAQDSSLHCWPKLGFEFAQRCFDLKFPKWLSCFMLDSQVYPYQVSSLDSNLCPINWTVDLEISCIGGKVNCGQLTVKPHDFWPTSTLWTHMNHLIKFGSQIHKKFDQITKRAKWSFLGFWLHKGNFWLFDLANGKPSSHMDSRTQWHGLDTFNKFKRSQMYRIDRWIF